MGSESRTVVLTGADSGIGRASAVQLARKGFDIGLHCAPGEEQYAEQAVEELRGLGVQAQWRAADLLDLPGSASVVEELADAVGGRWWGLVNNAGGGDDAPALEMPWQQWRDNLTLNLDAAFLCAQLAARRMVAAEGGRIVNITSVQETQPRVGAIGYCAAKGGLGQVTRTLAIELGASGVLVNAVAPGEIATPLTGADDEGPSSRPGVPVGRTGLAHEVGAVVAFLCSDEASYVNGASWLVDGGMNQMGPHAGSDLTTDDWRSG
jgi:NAD(P)-dependent dehydrogenase (short-subunit alcohol dehydrogenase family)